MISRLELSSKGIGDYSELLVAAAFVASGAQVAMPFGNQRGWDLLVLEKEDKSWKSVQIKTVGRIKGGQSPSIQSSRGYNGKAAYSEDDIDLMVAVHPETGTLWRLTPLVFGGKRRINLSDECVWRGSIDRSTTPLADGKPLKVQRDLSKMAQDMKRIYREQADKRASMLAALPVERPEWASVASWDMAKRWCSGEGYKSIAKDYKITHSAARERVIRVLYRLSVRDLTTYMKRDRSRRKVPARDQLALALAAASGGVNPTAG